KRVYRTDEPGCYIVEFKDDATAFDGKKRGTIAGKGVLNNKISAHFFELLARAGIQSHYRGLLGDREMLVQAVEIIPVEVVTRNIVAGSLAKRIGVPEGTLLSQPVVEYYYKRDDLGDPMINCSHVAALGLATAEELHQMREIALKVNQVLREYLDAKGIILVDFKLEFGRADGRVLLADEISPDTCRFWDKETGAKMDKDRFRRDLGGVAEAYAEVWKRLTGEEG
ncbi:MAG: phosphoribosylaminoimidazolesuccinocarboxamide synthase, partial [Thermoanaerobacteraceae bacterium]|nr:phosphoribosylaminoimidazolesuccinocarboxamide synthase [Thermoanaerobacteraceae bacterium]